VIDSDGFHHLLFLFRETIEQYVLHSLQNARAKLRKIWQYRTKTGENMIKAMLFSGKKKPYWRYFAILANDLESETTIPRKRHNALFSALKA
jgi:hypothetical protein